MIIILLLTTLTGLDLEIKENITKNDCITLETNNNKINCIESIGSDTKKIILYLDKMIELAEKDIEEK
jgi:hypothetical protein